MRFAHYDEKIPEFIKSTFKNWKYKPSTKQWFFPAYKYNVEKLRNINEKFVPENVKIIDENIRFIKQKYLQLSKIIEKKYPFLRNYQCVDVAQMIIEPNSFNCDDVGLGKTIETGAVIDYTKPKNVLIIVPKALTKQWQQELESFYSLESFIVPDGKKRFEFYNELQSKNSFILIINYEKIRLDIDKFFKSIFFNLIIYDEITRLKSGSSKINNAIRKLQKNKIIGLTGTPVENSVKDLYSLMNVIDYQFFGKFSEFKKKYLIEDEWGGLVAREDAPTLLGIKLREFDGFIRWKKSEVLIELPEILQNYYRFQLTKQEKTHYEDIINEKAEVCKQDGTLINLEYDLAKLQVLQGFCSEPLIYFEEIIISSKKKLFYELITEYINGVNKGRKIVCFAKFRRVIDSYCTFLQEKKINCRKITGAVSYKERNKIITYFKETSENCILFATDGTISHGVNLQEASFLINIDLPWNPAVLHQRIGRLHRIGQKNVVNIMNLLAENTIEEAIVNKIYSKMKMFDEIIKVNETSILELIKSELRKRNGRKHKY